MQQRGHTAQTSGRLNAKQKIMPKIKDTIATPVIGCTSSQYELRPPKYLSTTEQSKDTSNWHDKPPIAARTATTCAVML